MRSAGKPNSVAKICAFVLLGLISLLMLSDFVVRGVGLADHWRKTGRWGDFARPLGEDDFEML